MPPNPEQKRLADLPVGNVLVVAPAGCGKTDALADRARAVLVRGDVASPRRIAAVTFSNKARDNLASRMRKIVGSGWQRHVRVTNFHGLAARVIKAHGGTLGIPKDIGLPEARWRRRQLRELGVDGFAENTPFEQVLHDAKFGRFDDDEVMERLEASNHGAAIEFERSRGQMVAWTTTTYFGTEGGSSINRQSAGSIKRTSAW